jgi:H+/gluconate symporter-like permease
VAEHGIDPALLHRLTAIRAGTLDALPHNGTALRLLQISKLTHRESYFHVVMTVIVGVIISLVAVIALGSAFGSFWSTAGLLAERRSTLCDKCRRAHHDITWLDIRPSRQ